MFRHGIMLYSNFHFRIPFISIDAWQATPCCLNHIFFMSELSVLYIPKSFRSFVCAFYRSYWYSQFCSQIKSPFNSMNFAFHLYSIILWICLPLTRRQVLLDYIEFYFKFLFHISKTRKLSNESRNSISTQKP